MKRMRRFEACVTFRSPEGSAARESVPVIGEDYDTAKSTALSYVLQILRLQNFELRIVGT
jgi:hypothetical protein